MPFAVILRTTIVALAVCAGYLPAQSTLTRFFVLPDQSPNAGSESQFTGTEGTTQTPYAFDFTEDLRYDRGAFMTLSQDLVNPFVWNVVDFHLTATDPALGSQVVFSRPLAPGPYGTFTSSDPNGFPDNSTVNVSISGDITATGPLSGVWPTSTTLTMGGMVVPGFYHNVLPLTGEFSGGIGGMGAVTLFTKNDFYPPAVTWEMILKSAASSAQPAGEPAPTQARGGFTMQRGITNPNVYSIWNLHIEVDLTQPAPPASPVPPVVITTPPAQTAGLLTFDPGSRGLTGSLSLLVDGVPATMTVDGIGEAFTGCVMHPTSIVFDEPTGFGPVSLVHFECTTTEVVPYNPPMNDFQIGMTTSLVFRGRASDFYACGATYNALPGINTPVGDIPVTVDDLLVLSLSTTPYFSNMVGIMPPSGEMQISVNIPNDPVLIGATFFFGGGTFDPTTFAVHAATNSHRVVVK
jgi:hypothetical protein